jgi:hypothetical protein
VFTTSYDLIIYWSMGYGEHAGTAYGPLKDLFWGGAGRCEFDPDDTDLRPGSTPVYFLHGAMHLVVEGSGVTRKLKRGLWTVLEQFGMPIPGDPRARPLLVSEGVLAGQAASHQEQRLPSSCATRALAMRPTAGRVRQRPRRAGSAFG